MSSIDFAAVVSEVSGRLRHDLKGGLITLRMGLEALSDEEELKPHLLERTEHLETLADKLILLLRMGQMRPYPVRVSALLGEFRSRVAERFPTFELELVNGCDDLKPELDSDAVLLAWMELVENAVLAQATKLVLKASLSDEVLNFEASDNGVGVKSEDSLEQLTTLGVSHWQRPGLGLAIVDGCVRGHLGGLLVEPGAQGKGLRVQMQLRL